MSIRPGFLPRLRTATRRRGALLATAAAILAAPLVAPAPAAAQSAGPGWFVPSQPQPRREAAPAPTARPAPRQAPVQQVPIAPPPGAANPALADQDQAPVQLPQLPVPELPVLPKGTSPPAAVIGVIGVPEIMRASTAAQEVEKVIGERRQKLAEDAQKEQNAWRDLQQQLANQRSGLNADQVRAKERELQDRVTNAQRSFRDRNRIIQEAAQVSLSQIERTLIGVIREVAESRSMNLVLHRSQVALNVNEFDITDQVLQQMNKVLPSVQIPADGVSPAIVAQKGAPADATKASAPATASPTTATPAAPTAGAPAPARR